MNQNETRLAQSVSASGADILGFGIGASGIWVIGCSKNSANKASNCVTEFAFNVNSFVKIF